jgi:phosphocarrier protein HPr
LIQKEITILNRLGLHARPAAQFVKLAAQFKADVFLVRNGMRINAKSIMGVMMLAAEKGAKLTLECVGEDEADLCVALINLIESKFNED